ncbi:MAG: DNA primase [Treponema sp.]|nr:DNA primase [Treponema sp.]
MAGFISQESIEAVKNAADIVSVVSEYVKLDKRGSDFWGCCPFHGEKTASFHVVPDRNAYYCFGCHAGGSSAIKFIQDIEKVSFPEAVDILARKYGITLTYSDKGDSQVKFDDSKKKTIELYDRVSTTFHFFLTQHPSGKKALEYIKGRGISDETIEKFRIGYSPEDRFWLHRFLKEKNFSDDFLAKSGLFSQNYPNVSFFSDRLMFPIFNRHGECVAMGGRILHQQGENDRKYLNSRELPHYSKKNTLYAFNFARDEIRLKKTAIICEGYMDCIAYHQSGIKNAVATCGTALTEDHIKLISQTTSGGTVLLSFDSDGAGQEATRKSILLCRRAGLTVKIVRLRGGKDPAEIMVNYGAATLTDDVNCAIIDSDYLFENLTHKYPIDTPEGKTKVALEFFPYIDALQNNIQKESSLDLLCQKLNISRQAVERDFNNRQQAQKQTVVTQKVEPVQDFSKLKKNAELKVLLAVISDTQQFDIVRRELNEDEFETAEAKELFVVLEECAQKGNLSFSNVCEHCGSDELVRFITESVMSGEYATNTAKIVSDGIQLIKQKGLERQRDYILSRIRELGTPEQPEKKEELQQLLHEIMNINNLINSKKE